MSEPLVRIRLARTKRDRSAEQWKDAIIAAHGLGYSLRNIADAAGVSHVRVLQIVRGK